MAPAVCEKLCPLGRVEVCQALEPLTPDGKAMVVGEESRLDLRYHQRCEKYTCPKGMREARAAQKAAYLASAKGLVPFGTPDEKPEGRYVDVTTGQIFATRRYDGEIVPTGQSTNVEF